MRARNRMKDRISMMSRGVELASVIHKIRQPDEDCCLLDVNGQNTPINAKKYSNKRNLEIYRLWQMGLEVPDIAEKFFDKHSKRWDEYLSLVEDIILKYMKNSIPDMKDEGEIITKNANEIHTKDTDKQPMAEKCAGESRPEGKKRKGIDGKKSRPCPARK